jgi:Leucine-rich repeat (LRR) protein
MSRQITPATTLENLKREAKRWLKALRDDVDEARARLRRVLPNAPDVPTLRDVQHALAVEHGLPGWTALRDRLAQDAPMRRYERVAEALVTAYGTGEEGAMRVVWDYFGHMRAWDGMRRYVRLGLGRREEPENPEDDEITLEEARYLVARAQDFESWAALTEFAASVPPGKATLAAKSVAMHALDDAGAKQRVVRSRDWDEVIAVMREQRLTGLDASGQMTDALVERFSRLDHITTLDLNGSKAITDDGLRHLARLPGLRHLNLGGCPITDRGAEVLRRLPALESVGLVWTKVTDVGAAHLAACESIRAVDLSGTPSGDGAIRALAGKRELRDFRSGNGVTDAGFAALHEIPALKSWQGGESRLSLTGFDAGPTFLMLRGSFTNAGLAQLVGLDGLFALNVDDSHLAITGAGLAPLVDLPHLGWLAFDAKDESMPYMAALPHLRFLMCQDTTAGDDGFVALSRSRTIEHIWGRRCYNLRRRGFMALADMPALGHLSVSCRNVDDIGLSALPRFPALRELMPMDVPDDGYRHIGRCKGLESLVLMYCRDTTDAATEHITSLTRLGKYFASYNRITDRTPELLSGMPSLEEVTFDTCTGLTNAGVAALARLPRLRELRVSGMPHVSADVTAAFAAPVRVSYAL